MSQVGLNVEPQAEVTDFQTLYKEATILLNAGDYQPIVDGLGAQIIEAYPDEVTGYVLYAKALEQATNTTIEKSEWDLAENYSKKAFELNPTYQYAMSWAEIAWQNGHNDIALQAYKKASETPKGKSQAWPYVNMATIYSFSDNKAKELSNLDRALELLNNPSTGKETAAHTDVLFKLAECYEFNNVLSKAIESYQAILKKDPLNAKATTALEKLQSTNNQ